MKKFSWQAVMKWLDARHVRERAILLGAGLAVVGMLWLALVHDVLTAAKVEVQRNISVTQGRIVEEQNSQNDIRATYTSDPNSYALSRQRELREATDTANMRLNALYGELISPQQMSQVLTTILQRETMLKLISLGNVDSEALLTAAAAPDGSAEPGVQVFKHGLRMVFEGSFLETVDYLRSLEQLEGNFFWENLEFDLGEYPTARISLDIYTLSTERGFIGV